MFSFMSTNLSFLYSHAFVFYLVGPAPSKKMEPETEDGALKKHKRLHTEEASYVCNQCDKIFSDSDNLKDHKITHLRETTYVCIKSFKSFSQAGHLKNH